MKQTKTFCDVCKKESTIEEKRLEVIFTTDQTEGRGVPNYLSNEKLDICGNCMAHILKGNYLFGHGAQGYNQYEFKNQPKEI